MIADYESHTLGAKIRSLRLAAGLTQGQLAQGEITPGLISQIESNRVAPSARVIELIAEQIGVEPAELLLEVEARSRQLQQLRRARERLQAGNGAGADAVLRDIGLDQVLYVPPAELKLLKTFAKELQGDDVQTRKMYAEVELEVFLSGDTALAAESMQRQGDFLLKTGQSALAYYSLDQAKRFLLQSAPDDWSRFFALSRNMALCAYKLQDSQRALSLAKEAESYLDRVESREDAVEVYHLMSALYIEVQDLEKALAYAKRAKTLYQELMWDEAVLDATMNQAVIHRLRKQYQQAMKILPGLINDYYLQGRPVRQANAWIERAVCEHHLGLFEDARRSLDRSRSLVPPDSVEYAGAERARADLLTALGQTADVPDLLETAVRLFLQHDAVTEAISGLQALARHYRKSGQGLRAKGCQARANGLRIRADNARRTLELSDQVVDIRA